MLYLCTHYALPTGTWHHYMGLLLLFLVITLLVSFLCSTLESVLMTTTLSYISLREDEGDKAAVLFKKYKLDTERPLAAILSLNTIANTVGSVGIGMQATLVFGNKFDDFHGIYHACADCYHVPVCAAGALFDPYVPQGGQRRRQHRIA